MKQGRSLTALASELERQVESRRDFLAPTRMLRAEVIGEIDDETKPKVVLRGLPDGNGGMELTPYAHKQVGEYTEIPARYYDRMLTNAPHLLAMNINEWLHRELSSRRMVRTLDNKVRAFLSDRYRPMDNYDLATAVLPALKERQAEVVSAELTETRMYIKATAPWLRSEVKGSRRVGDIVEGGVIISNSELGNGTLRAEGYFNFLACLNGMIREASIRKYHVGKGAGELTEAVEVFSDNTKKLDDAAFWAKVHDVVLALFDRERFEAEVATFSMTTGQPIKGDPVKVVDETIKRLSLPPASKTGILRNLIDGGDLSRWGLVNAVTATANNSDDYEVATLLERAGGKVIDLSEKEWSAVSEAA